MTYDVLNPGFGLNPIAADGITDDKINLQLIINHANSQGGGEIVLPGNRAIAISSNLIIYSNLTFRTSFGRVTLKPFNTNPMYAFMSFSTGNSYNVCVDGIDFDGTTVKLTHGIVFLSGANIKITNCTFKNFDQSINNDSTDSNGDQAIYFNGDMTNVEIKNCTFDTIKGGIFLHQRNQRIRIEDNYFNKLIRHAIHLQGSESQPHYCSDVIIKGNYMIIQKQPQSTYGTHGIYITCGDVDFNGTSSHHDNVTVADNTIIGPGRSFPGEFGAADLFSLKDITRLKCYGNTARNGGDLGYAIERCHYGVVSNNTADQNNRCGISVFGSSHISVIGNVCGNNEKDHDGNNGSGPYGGIRVEFDSVHVILSGNHLYDVHGTGASQTYGIVVKDATVPLPAPPTATDTRSPFNIKIGANHYSGNALGDIYNTISSTIIQDASASVLP
jgi:parallel beta-helix repeat protein